MSHVDELRRPVRILRPADVGAAGPDRARLSGAGLAPAADRFRRTLAAPRGIEAMLDQEARSGASPTGRPPMSEATRPAVRLAMPALLEVVLDEAEAAQGGHERGREVEAVAAAARQAGNDLPSPDERPRRSVEGRPSLAAASAGAQEDKWADDMARKVIALCQRADPAFVTWTVTVPMDPDTLPQTDLRLHMAPHWLSLRFASQSSQSVRLIAAHRDRLVELLERTPGLPHGIDVEIS